MRCRAGQEDRPIIVVGVALPSWPSCCVVGGAVSDVRPPADLDYCYLTTTGRHTAPHRIEIRSRWWTASPTCCRGWRPLGLGSQPDDLAGGGPRDRGGSGRRGLGSSPTWTRTRSHGARSSRSTGRATAATSRTGAQRRCRWRSTGPRGGMMTRSFLAIAIHRRGLRTGHHSARRARSDEASEPRSGDPA